VEEEAVGQGRGSLAGGGSKLQMRRDGRPAADARQGVEKKGQGEREGKKDVVVILHFYLCILTSTGSCFTTRLLKNTALAL
jgi:hypothetical protein